MKDVLKEEHVARDATAGAPADRRVMVGIARVSCAYKMGIFGHCALFVAQLRVRR